jgi:hypothetical protein
VKVIAFMVLKEIRVSDTVMSVLHKIWELMHWVPFAGGSKRLVAQLLTLMDGIWKLESGVE